MVEQHSTDYISSLRRNYTQSQLRRSSLHEDPFEQFKKWFNQTLETKEIEPNAMVLGTTNGNKPSSRTVLLKSFNSNGFIFFTNYKSRKAQEILDNENVSLLFPWYSIERQVMILGKAMKISKSESYNYFKSRPRNSQISAWVSQQSQIIDSREELLKKLEIITREFCNIEIQLPIDWGGFLVKPFEFEFWQGRENRLHDRFRYSLGENSTNKSWLIDRLSP
tara:strand:+ start:394 stop:1059 length:666 start_codon:yes stop_codon:yes gene_type:complete